MEKEIFKPIFGYEGLYEISNFGRVRSLKRVINGKGGGSYLNKEKILLPRLDKYGYYGVTLCLNSKVKCFTIHRLVAIAFLGKENGKQVNHINGIKTDNNACNLEWVTVAENIKHSYRVLKRVHNWNRVGTEGEGAIRNVRIKMIDKSNNEREFYSIKKASEEMKISIKTISRVLKGQQEQTREGHKFIRA